MSHFDKNALYVARNTRKRKQYFVKSYYLLSFIRLNAADLSMSSLSFKRLEYWLLNKGPNLFLPGKSPC